MSRSQSVDKPHLIGAYAGWIIEHKLRPILLIVIEAVLWVFDYWNSNLDDYAIHALIVVSVAVGVTFAYFYGMKWRIHMHVFPWYVVQSGQYYLKKLFVSSNLISKLVLTISLGPSVWSWTVRFRVSKDLVLVDWRTSESWTTTYSIRDGILCLSSERIESEVIFTFDFQARDWRRASVPESVVFFDFASNIQLEEFPSNKDSCTDLTMSKTIPLPVDKMSPSTG